MKRLFLLRHAKAAYGSTDQSRRLAPRGKADAYWLGQYLKKLDLLPDYIISSSAARTRDTFSQLQDASKITLTAHFRDDFYLATAGHMAQQMQLLGPNIKAPMIIGHNPGLALLFKGLMKPMGQGEPPQKYPSCSLAVLEFDIENWSELASNTGQLLDLIIPSEFRKLES